MTYQIKTIKSQTQFETLIDDFSTLQYWISEVYDNIETGENGAVALVAIVDGLTVAYIIADDQGCHFIETRENWRRVGIATRLLKRTKSVFMNDVCSEACKEMCKKLGLEYDEVSKR